MVLTFTKRKVLHYPKLDTILMVEEFIKEWSGHYKKKKIWQKLPKKMMYQTFCVIIDYLEHTHKIAKDSVGVYGYVYSPEIARYYINRKDLSRNK